MIDLGLSPVLTMATSIGGIFNYGVTRRTTGLMGLQVEMLANISAKLDVLHDQLLVVMEQNKQIYKLLWGIPDATVAELYKSDLEGIFLLTREKFAAHGGNLSARRNPREASNRVFEGLLKELQLVRSKLLANSSYMEIPQLGMCLYHELLLMYIVGEPESTIRQALKSYRSFLYFWRHLGEGAYSCLNIMHGNSVAVMKAAEARLPSSKGYRWETVRDKYDVVTWTHNDLFALGTPVAVYTGYTKFLETWYSRKLRFGSDYSAAAAPLIEARLTKVEWLPCDLVLYGASDWYVRDMFMPFAHHKGPYPKGDYFDAVLPLKFSDSFEISGTTRRQLFDYPAVESLAYVTSDAEITRAFAEESQKLLLYSALIYCSDALSDAIDQLLSTAPLQLRSSMLGITRQIEHVNAQASVTAANWASALSKAQTEVQDEALREIMTGLKERMRSLSETSGDILAQYKEAERELLEALPENVLDAVLRFVKPIGIALEASVSAFGHELEVFAQNVVMNATKAIGDVGAEIGRAVNNTGELIEAVGGALENTIRFQVRSLEQAVRRAAEGKLVDALWHLATNQITNAEEVHFKAMQKSDLLRAIAQSATTAYGGPQGAAAFTAWYTYRVTGDLGLALKMSVISYFTTTNASALNMRPDMSVPSSLYTPIDLSDEVRRAVMTAGVGAAAIAASGGSEQDVMEGFLKGAALSAASAYYRSITNANLDGRGPTDGPVDKIGLEEHGRLEGKGLVFLNKKNEYVLDIRRLKSSISHVGLVKIHDATMSYLAGEQGPVMQGLAQIPYMNGMGYFHDQFCAVEGFGGAMTVLTIAPAIVITVAGTPVPLLDHMIDLVIQNSPEESLPN